MLTKSKLNSVEVSSSEALTDSSIGHDEFVLINSVKRIYWYERRNEKFKDLIVLRT